jgi:uncharacterized protein (TIGR02246 family)
VRRLLSIALLLAAVPVIAQAPATPQPSPAASAAATQRPTEADVIALEQSLWAAFVASDADAVDKLMLPDFVDIAGVFNTRDEILDALRHEHMTCTKQPVTIDHAIANVLSDNVATIAYQVTLTKVCDQRTVKIESNMTTVWVRHDGRWQMHLHTERAFSGFSFQSQ